jgi:hypothetical protein
MEMQHGTGFTPGLWSYHGNHVMHVHERMWPQRLQRGGSAPAGEAELPCLVWGEAEHIGEHQGVLPKQRVGYCALGAVHHQLQQRAQSKQA